MKVACLGKCSYLVGERQVFIKDEAEIASIVCGAEREREREQFWVLASRCLSPYMVVVVERYER